MFKLLTNWHKHGYIIIKTNPKKKKKKTEKQATTKTSKYLRREITWESVEKNSLMPLAPSDPLIKNSCGRYHLQNPPINDYIWASKSY